MASHAHALTAVQLSYSTYAALGMSCAAVSSHADGLPPLAGARASFWTPNPTICTFKGFELEFLLSFAYEY